MVIPWDLRSPTLWGRFQLDRRLRRVLGKSDRFTASVQGKRRRLSALGVGLRMCIGEHRLVKVYEDLSMGLPIYGPSELSIRPKDGEPAAHSTS